MLAGHAACLALGMGLILGPYLLATGSLTPRAVVARILGRPASNDRSDCPSKGSGVVWRLADGTPMRFDVKEPGTSLRRRGLVAAGGRFAVELADAFDYGFGVLVLAGAWVLRRRPLRRTNRFVHAFFLVFSVAAYLFAAREGYLCPRHLLPLVAASVGCAGWGAVALGQWLFSRLRLTAWRGVTLARRASEGTVCDPRLRFGLVSMPTESDIAQEGSGPAPAQRVGWGWAVVALAVMASLGHTTKSLSMSRWAHRRAGQWLAIQPSEDGRVLDSLGLTGLYSGRPTYSYLDARTGFADPRLAYVVVEQQELRQQSGRSQTLRSLLEVAGQRAAMFSDALHGPQDPHAVLVYRWDPARLTRWVGAAQRARESFSLSASTRSDYRGTVPPAEKTTPDPFFGRL